MTTQPQSKIPLPFSKAEYDNRLAALRKRMGERGIDVLLVFIPANVLYLTGYVTIGFTNFQALIVPRTGRPFLFIREMERLVAQATTWVEDFDIFADDDDPMERLRAVLAAHDWLGKGLGAEMNGGFVSPLMMREIEQRLGGLKDGSGLVEAGRRIKSTEELALIRSACRVTEAGITAAFDAIRAGTTENMVAAAAYTAMMAAGADFFVNDPIVTSGWRSGIPHTTFANRTLERGDTVLLEFGGCHRRYFGPLMRTAVIGPVKPAIEKMSGVVVEALNAAIAAIRPGVTSGSVDEACRRPIEAAGYEPYFRKRTGYSVGSAFAPTWGEGHIISLRKDDPSLLEPGMVFHMPPALRMPHQYCVGFSETVAVTETGCEVLTRYPRELRVVQ
ncbi:MAG TPA: Xaa-Pro peptidase family protein [Stellaceae bacterium]|nr:Xaa-Pro peptidase family protein [Stellaceae bacterium]